MVRVQAKRILALAKFGAASHAEQHDESYTVFHQILDSRLSDAEKSEERLVQEGQSLVAAGSQTTAHALEVATVHLLHQPLILARLRRELLAVMPTPDARPTLAQLEALPFLTAVIKESVRLAGSTATRTARLSREPLRYKDWIFPAGTPVSVTLNDVLTDDRLFPSPNKFDPMRWVIPSMDPNRQEQLSVNATTDRYFVAFSRGPRSCVGIWLAWAELYITIAYMLRRFDMELFETGIEEVPTSSMPVSTREREPALLVGGAPARP